MTILFAIFAFMILIAMAGGQFRVAYRAINYGKAGYGRFTYKRAETPLGFWIMAAAEWLGFAIAVAYLLALVAGLLLP